MKTKNFWLFVFGAVLLIISLIVISIYDARMRGAGQPPAREDNTYSGSLEDYTVSIREIDRGRGFYRTLKLQQTVGDQIDVIIGEDKNDDGVWEKISWCQYPAGGQPTTRCLLASFDDFGGTLWESYSHQRPLLLGEVMAAKEELTKAMIAVHNKDHRTSHFRKVS